MARLSGIGTPALGDSSEGFIPFVRPLATFQAEPEVHEVTVVPRWRRQTRDQSRKANIRLGLDVSAHIRRHSRFSTSQSQFLVLLVVCHVLPAARRVVERSDAYSGVGGQRCAVLDASR